MDSQPRVRRSPRRIVKGLLFLVITCGVVALLVYSPIFTLQKLNVKGAVYLTEEDIAYIARIHRGQPLFDLETAEVTENLLKDLRIESAMVKRNLPYSLDINITERVPVATVASEYGYVDIDRQGKVIAAYRSLRHVPIPLITGITVRDIYIGDDINDDAVKKVLTLVQQIPLEALNQLSEINAANPESIVIYTAKAVQIRLGNLEDLERKARLIDDFLQDQRTSPYTVEYVDFSYEVPVIRLKDMPLEDKLTEGKGI
ncbi:MAG: FtsQ-type POTRA domain-containing protein [Selenomonas ruminantium]|nr:FtsQ-type POTRA domain-containing protein [Selenomonas ruminantium]